MKAVRELVMLIENEQERFYRIAYSYVKNQEDALDIVHNAIVKALQSCRGLRSPEYAQTWFCRILINESISHLRRARRFVPLEEIAQILSANLSAVKSRLYRALKLLKLDLEVLDDDGPKGL